MNRYILEGIASDLAGGADILVIIPPYGTVANVFHQIMEYADEEYTQARLVYSEIYHASGGKITAVSAKDPDDMRGRSPSVILIPSGMSRDFLTTRQRGVEIIEY